MAKLLNLTIFIVTANVLMLFVGFAITEMNPVGFDGKGFCYKSGGSIIDTGLINTKNATILNNLPNPNPTISTTSSGFTDVFGSMISWFKSLPGISYAYNVVSAPYNILDCTGLPDAFVLGIGLFWYIISFIVLISFLFWGG